jgi:hypothetical protein
MSLLLQTTSALNLTLEGSVGSFSVGGREGQSSIEVMYFLTHVGLDFKSGASVQMLSHLAPVREMFEAETLEFDEIMQRDIDDARVSSELIPYLLDPRSRDLVKLFPPIIVVVLPVKADANRPDDCYPKVEVNDQKIEGQSYSLHITRSGPLGGEVFQFEQPILNGRMVEHDLTRLKLNTNRCKLVIVDGQHRAMALLAIYRNLKQEWSDQRRAPFKDYYEEWTENYIRQFKLERISLPVMLCTFPRLDEAYQGDYDLKKAARGIFLTLNKTARKVSESRNRLLDDNDLIALLLRDTLSSIKQKDARSEHSLRISNVELDQMHDRIKIDSPIALTGVNHIYYLIEHLMFNAGDQDVKGAKPRSGKFSRRKDLGGTPSERLDARNILGSAVADATTRDFYTADAGNKLTKEFRLRYGDWIVSALEDFKAFEAHGQAVLWLEQELRVQDNQKLRPILFEGQGIGRVFETHRENLREKLIAGEFQSEAPKIKEILARLDATATLVDKSITRLRTNRAERFLQSISDKGKLRIEDGEYHPKIIGFVSDLYDNVFTTVAFQTALVAGFFGELERASRALAEEIAALDTKASFDEFMVAMNEFFTPSSSSSLKRLIETFAGQLEGEPREWKLAPSSNTFREVVYRGEMQPDQWPKYKYLLLEIWRPSNRALGDSVTREREKCRDQVFNSLVEDRRKELLQRLSKREEDLTEEERRQPVEESYKAFRAFLNNIGWNVSDIPSRANMVQRTTHRVEDTQADQAAPEETWVSTETT